MNKFIPRFLQFQGFNLKDLKEWLLKKEIEIYLEATQELKCCRCGEKLNGVHSKYKMKVRDLDIKTLKTIIIFHRRKGYCSKWYIPKT